MSGGVDSSVTLALLTDPAITSHLDLDISAVFMRNWSPLQNEVDHHSFETDCEWEKDWEDVKEVCKARGVKAELVSMFRCRVRRCFCRLLTPPRLSVC
jgi:tRNA U34 2-thiouridine synthase MnmA/TrmU